MDPLDWCENVSRIVRETKDNINKTNAHSGSRTLFNDYGQINFSQIFKETEALNKLREFEKNLRRDSQMYSHKEVVPFEQKHKLNESKTCTDKLSDYFFDHFSQGFNSKGHDKELLADIKDKLDRIIFFNESEKKRLDVLETEVFMKNKLEKLDILSKLQEDSNNSALERLEENLKLVNAKLSAVMTLNEGIIKQLDKAIAQSLRDHSSKLISDSGSAENVLKDSIVANTIKIPHKHEITNDIPIWHSNSGIIQQPPEEPNSFKTLQQLMSEYEAEKRQLQLLENEGFTSPTIKYEDYFLREE